MPNYTAPGVYIEEIDTGAMPIAGVGTSTAGFIGPTRRGPEDPNAAGYITSFKQFKRKFGDATEWTIGTDKDSIKVSSNVPYAIDGFFANGGSGCYVARVIAKQAKENEEAQAKAPVAASKELGNGEKTEGGETKVADVEAIGSGEWGNNVVVIVDEASSGDPNRFSIIVRYWEKLPEGEGDTEEERTADKIAKWSADRPAIRPEPNEVYDELSAKDDDDRFYESILNDASDLVRITKLRDGRPATKPLDTASGGPEPTLPRVEKLDGGSNGTGIDDYAGETSLSDGETTRTGLEAFKAIDEISLLNAPNENEVKTPTELRGDLVEHCTTQGDRFAILQAKKGFEENDDLPDGSRSDRGYSAVYFPWLEVTDLHSGTPTLIPPGGHVAGVIARTDGERGVHKAPANEELRGINGLQRDVTQSEQELLNPKGVNCIRTFRGRGTLVYGARTTASNSLWKYINVRRLFLYIEESLQEGTQWAVFEPNNEALWARVRQSVSNFLTDVWSDGALMGETPEEAFYVKADRSTMTQNDIDNGKLVVEVGIAPAKPAEFVVFEITQWTSGAEAA